MCRLISSVSLLLIWCFCLATALVHQRQCQSIGDQCQTTDDCCSSLICYSDEETNRCVPWSSANSQASKRLSEDVFIPPYYNPSQQLYPYGITKPGLAFFKGSQSPLGSHGRQLEWDHCQFHEDCGEGQCCYVHFRFRSLPKLFCRPNRNDANELCGPLTKYRSLKDVLAWKQQV